MTTIMMEPSIALAMAALPMAEAPRSSMWEPVRSAPSVMEIRVAKPATTRAWTCVSVCVCVCVCVCGEESDSCDCSVYLVTQCTKKFT